MNLGCHPKIGEKIMRKTETITGTEACCALLGILMLGTIAIAGFYSSNSADDSSTSPTLPTLPRVPMLPDQNSTVTSTDNFDGITSSNNQLDPNFVLSVAAIIFALGKNVASNLFNAVNNMSFFSTTSKQKGNDDKVSLLSEAEDKTQQCQIPKPRA